MKWCPDCGEAKAVSEFGLNKRMPDGRARYCKACFGVRSKKSYRKRAAEQGRSVRERVEAPEGHKYCPRCQEIKPTAEFGRNRSDKSDGLTSYCKPCHTLVGRENRVKNHGSERNYKLKYLYGITEDDYERMLAQQGGLCAVCRENAGTHVDHCHSTGRVRGILCFNCNNGLGHFRDDLTGLALAAAYLWDVEVWADRPAVPGPRRAEVAPTRSSHLSQRYGLRHADVERMIEAQSGLCAACWEREPEHVDHCHGTGEVRKALCLPCNTGIGQFRDDARFVWRALEYLAPPIAWEDYLALVTHG
ncbi:endonuclease VII domain-containing protein [Nonomuraea soli]|uniref:Recombination endonuclease VII n=1 Tax=Nonomuraea soli TaxID=1032476 RepID=A0A7W0CRY5_9ACTN|nr:endonuclease VII domain-containing protein [Nonomuraea soli]MBA2896103.1 hypothetical protein [Nonomuraea soli]